MGDGFAECMVHEFKCPTCGYESDDTMALSQGDKQLCSACGTVAVLGSTLDNRFLWIEEI